MTSPLSLGFVTVYYRTLKKNLIHMSYQENIMDVTQQTTTYQLFV